MLTEQVDALIVGAGPAGLSAATRLRAGGVKKVLAVDREEAPGGVPRHCLNTGFGWRDLRRIMTGPTYAAHLVEKAQTAGVEIRLNTTVIEWRGPRHVVVTSPRGIAGIQAKTILLATGCRERPRAARLVPGSRPAGIFTTGTLHQLTERFPDALGRRAVVVGAEHVSFSAVMTLRRAGMGVAAMITEHASHQSYGAYRRIATFGARIPLLTGHRITKILGSNRLDAIEATHLASGAVRTIRCDTVIFTGDWIPEHELARKGGLAMDSGTRGPAIDGAMRTSVQGVFSAGNLVHAAETADIAALSGLHAAEHALVYLQEGAWRSSRLLAFHYHPQDVRWISPNLIDPRRQAVPRRHFILRVARDTEDTVLEVSQQDYVLWTRRYRRLKPNLPVYLPASFVQKLEPEAGPVRIRIVD